MQLTADYLIRLLGTNFTVNLSAKLATGCKKVTLMTVTDVQSGTLRIQETIPTSWNEALTIQTCKILISTSLQSYYHGVLTPKKNYFRNKWRSFLVKKSINRKWNFALLILSRFLSIMATIISLQTLRTNYADSGCSVLFKIFKVRIVLMFRALMAGRCKL